MKNIYLIITAIIMFAIGMLTVSGNVQEVIHFDGCINEMSFVMFCIFIGGICLLGINYKKR